HAAVRDPARLEADGQRVEGDRIVELREQVPDRDAGEDRDDRKEQKRECDCRCDGEGRREERPHLFGSFVRPKPPRLRSSRPRFESTFFTKARRAACFPPAATTAISYLI